MGNGRDGLAKSRALLGKLPKRYQATPRRGGINLKITIIMKETLKKTRTNFIYATKALQDAMYDAIKARGAAGLSFGEFNRPVVTDNLENPIEEALEPHELDAVRVNDGELQAKVVGFDEWYPLTFDAAEEELYVSEELLSACLIREFDKE